MSQIQLVLFICLLWSLSETAGQFLARMKRREAGVKAEKGARKDKGSRTFIWLGLYASIFITVLFSVKGIAPLPEWLLYPGIALMLLGIALRQWAIHVLGRFFTTKVSIAEGHMIIKDGPYRFVRHPSYSGGLLTIFGLGLAMTTWAGIIVIIALALPAYYYRIIVEEKALMAEFGKEYEEYAGKTKRLIPYIL